MLIAACVQDSSGSFLRLYRVDAATLAILDSGRIDLKNDVYRSWSRTKIPQAAFVPAPSGGYWLFLSTLEAPPSPTTVAVRLRRDLEVIRPTTVVADEERPLSAAPMDALVVIECPRTRWEWDGSRTAWGSLRLLYTGFGSDGRLYRQVFEDSMTSHRLE
ncbi:MAG: hypothetical protein JSU73_10320 [candidate division WOR-3 bacterium]|nr:MAG: hypothetical protein JSU73_10320 [candidate division WOR-3 bacterium]